MTSMRAVAYRRVMKALRGLGALDEADVRHALAAAAVLTDDLIDTQRWTPRRAQQLLDDIWACGPDAAADVPMAA